MKKTISITVIGILGLIVSQTQATLVEWELPGEFIREYNYEDPSLSTNFNVGVTFSSISRVYIDWSGGITAGLAQDCHPVTCEPIGDPHPEEVAIYASLGFNPNLRREEIWGGVSTYPNPETFDSLIEFELPVSTTWSDLLDGMGTIGIGYTETIFLNGYYIEHGNVALDDATLIIDGAVIPEPSMIILLTTGCVYILHRSGCNGEDRTMQAAL